MARKIGNKYAQFLIGKLLRGERHYFFVGGKSVKKNYRADGRAGASFVDVSGHIAAARGGEHGVHFIGFSARENKSGDAQQNTDHRLKQCATTQRCNGERRAHECTLAGLTLGVRSIVSA